MITPNKFLFFGNNIYKKRKIWNIYVYYQKIPHIHYYHDLMFMIYYIFLVLSQYIFLPFSWSFFFSILFCLSFLDCLSVIRWWWYILKLCSGGEFIYIFVFFLFFWNIKEFNSFVLNEKRIVSSGPWYEFPIWQIKKELFFFFFEKEKGKKVKKKAYCVLSFVKKGKKKVKRKEN